MTRWLVLSGMVWMCALALAGAQTPPSPEGLRRARGPAFPGTIDQQLTRLGWETRIAKAEARLDFSTGDWRDLARETADYLVFADEAPLAAPVRGTSSFAKVFAASGPRDRKGRSLRDLDLTTALLRYRTSYMVYSPAFSALPAEARAAVIARMKDKLDGRDGAASEILSETLTGWR